MLEFILVKGRAYILGRVLGLVKCEKQNYTISPRKTKTWTNCPYMNDLNHPFGPLLTSKGVQIPECVILLLFFFFFSFGYSWTSTLVLLPKLLSYYMREQISTLHSSYSKKRQLFVYLHSSIWILEGLLWILKIIQMRNFALDYIEFIY